jgi:hypothetical protein
VSQVLTVRSESLAAGFAPGDDDTRSTESDRRLSFDERTPDMSFKFGLRFLNDLFPVHRAHSRIGRVSHLRCKASVNIRSFVIHIAQQNPTCSFRFGKQMGNFFEAFSGIMQPPYVLFDYFRSLLE